MMKIRQGEDRQSLCSKAQKQGHNIHLIDLMDLLGAGTRGKIPT